MFVGLTHTHTRLLSRSCTRTQQQNKRQRQHGSPRGIAFEPSSGLVLVAGDDGGGDAVAVSLSQLLPRPDGSWQLVPRFALGRPRVSGV